MPPDDPSTSPGDLRSLFADDPDMAEIIGMFTGELPERVRQLSNSFSAGELADLQRLAHQLKGASGGYGFPTLGEAAGALESSLVALGRDAGAPNAALLTVEQELDRLISICRRVAG